MLAFAVIIVELEGELKGTEVFLRIHTDERIFNPAFLEGPSDSGKLFLQVLSITDDSLVLSTDP